MSNPNIQKIVEHEEHEAEPVALPAGTVYYIFAYRRANDMFWCVTVGWPVDASLEQQLHSAFGSLDIPIVEVRVFKIRLPIIGVPPPLAHAPAP